MATPKSETAQLRAELRRLWGPVDILIKALRGALGAVGKVTTVLAEEAAQLKVENEALREENRKLEELKGENEEMKGDKKSLKHRVKMHESWNHSSSEAIGYANRGSFRRKEEGCKAMERGEDPDVAVPKRNPGHQPGKPECRTTTSRATTESRLWPACARSVAGRIWSCSIKYRR